MSDVLLSWKGSIQGALRILIPAVVAFVAGRGWLASEFAGDLTAFLIALGSAFWSAYENRPT